jgi:hypothetical protein
MIRRWTIFLASATVVVGCKSPSSNPPYVQQDGVHVKAPFVNVQTGSGGTKVKAPFANVDTRSNSPANPPIGSTTSIHAPVQKPQSLGGAAKTPAQAPKVQNASSPSVSPLSSSSFYQQSSPGSYPPSRVNE